MKFSSSIFILSTLCNIVMGKFLVKPLNPTKCFIGSKNVYNLHPLHHEVYQFENIPKEIVHNAKDYIIEENKQIRLTSFLNQTTNVKFLRQPYLRSIIRSLEFLGI